MSPEDEMLELIKPYASSRSHDEGIVIASAELADDEALKPGTDGRVEWVFEGGKWVPRQVAPTDAADNDTVLEPTIRTVEVLQFCP